MKYRYEGEVTVNIPGVGTFEPGKEYEVEAEINHPDFEPVKEEKPKKSK
jgi:hypothetical protein